jgi:hypothetical protein
MNEDAFIGIGARQAAGVIYETYLRRMSSLAPAGGRDHQCATDRRS